MVSGGRALFIALDLGVLFSVGHQHTQQEFTVNFNIDTGLSSPAILKHNST